MKNKNNKWSWKKWANGVIVIPEDRTDIIKYGVAIVAMTLARLGYSEIGQNEMFMIGLVVKAIVDRIHYYLKYE